MAAPIGESVCIAAADYAQEHTNGWANWLWQDRDCQAPGAACVLTLHQGQSLRQLHTGCASLALLISCLQPKLLRALPDCKQALLCLRLVLAMSSLSMYTDAHWWCAAAVGGGHEVHRVGVCRP
jgi:hypothetical protein